MVLIISLATANLEVGKAEVSITQHFHIASFRGGLWFYDAPFPYMGSIWMIGKPESEIIKDWNLGDYGFSQEVYVWKNGELQKRNACNLPGVYYRHFESPREPPNSTLRISLWHPFLIFAILPSIWFFKKRKQLAKYSFRKNFER